MNMTNALFQLNGKEQNALHCIKSLIVARTQPLVIYCYGCVTIVQSDRSAFVGRSDEGLRLFTCDLLIIIPDESEIDAALITEIREMAAHLGNVKMIVHQLGFVLKLMNEGNLFFSWVHSNGMLLYERNATTQLFPPAIGREYKKQAEAFYTNDPKMANYLTERMQSTNQQQSQNEGLSTKPIEIRLTVDAKS